MALLVRGPQAAARAAEALAGWDEAEGGPVDMGQVEVWQGDLEAPRFGWSRGEWEARCGQVCALVHGGAKVNVVATAGAMVQPNLGGTALALAFAREAGAHVHHISTLSVFAHTDLAPGRFTEADGAGSLATVGRVYGGYAQTKYAAEWLVWQHAPALRGGSILRPGLITRDPGGRIGPGADWLEMWILAMDRLGCRPPDEALGRLWMDQSPVSHVAEAMATVLLHAQSHASPLGDLPPCRAAPHQRA